MISYFPLKLEYVINGNMARDYFKGDRRAMETYCVNVWYTRHKLPEELLTRLPISMSYNPEFDVYTFNSCLMISIDENMEVF